MSMNFGDFEVKLGVLGWSQARLSRELGVHANTVWSWFQGREVPRYAEALVECRFSRLEELREFRLMVEDLKEWMEQS